MSSELFKVIRSFMEILIFITCFALGLFKVLDAVLGGK